MSAQGRPGRENPWDEWAGVSAEQALARRYVALVQAKVLVPAVAVVALGCLAVFLLTRSPTVLSFLPIGLTVLVPGAMTSYAMTRPTPPEKSSALRPDDVRRVRALLREGRSLSPADSRLGLALRHEAGLLRRWSRWMVLGVVVIVVLGGLALGVGLLAGRAPRAGGFAFFALAFAAQLLAVLVLGRQLERETSGIRCDEEQDE